MRRLALFAILLASVPVLGQGESGLTIYNQNFAVVRQPVRLELDRGINDIQLSGTTAYLEPESVILRDPSGSRVLQILEQNYRADPVSQGLLMSLFEGQVIDFLIQDRAGARTVPGRILRSGYAPHHNTYQRYGNQHYASQVNQLSQPIIEVEGRLRFGLPGVPLFPSLADDTILKPRLEWRIRTDRPGRVDAELGYVTAGMSWEADYNVVAPEQGDTLELTGWITIDNQSGKTFPNARIKLLAGDVRKIQPGMPPLAGRAAEYAMKSQMEPAVTEKSFDEYHLYTLARASTLHDRETKQVEFVSAGGIASSRIYVYDGAEINWAQYRGYPAHNLRQEANFGIQFNSRVKVMQEFENSEENQLGLALPRGTLRFYRRDEDGQLEFTGENIIDHTPRDETIRVVTGNAFDLVGERIRADYRVDTRGHWVDESFEIKLRNHKEETVEIRVVEHLYRWTNWEITQSSSPHTKLDSRTIEFRVPVEPDRERTLTYTVHYSW